MSHLRSYKLQFYRIHLIYRIDYPLFHFLHVKLFVDINMFEGLFVDINMFEGLGRRSILIHLKLCLTIHMHTDDPTVIMPTSSDTFLGQIALSYSVESANYSASLVESVTMVCT